VPVVADSNQPAGTHSLVWKGKDDSGASCPSGVYFLRLISGLKIQTAKLVLVR
jgi:flagellar hook assembly protein FlgD